jgi:hypothetical protein
MIASILSGSLFFDGLSHRFDALHFYALIDAPVLESLRGTVAPSGTPMRCVTDIVLTEPGDNGRL